MATAKTTIELNGKLYDARTGKIISQKNTPKAVPRPTTGVVLDGFTRRSKPAAPRTSPKHTHAAKLQKSQTLMRPAVKKPKLSTPQPISQKHEVAKKQNPLRAVRASQVPKSKVVSKFNPHVNSYRVIKTHEAIPVATPATTVTHGPLTNQVAHLATSTEAHVRHSVDVIEESLRNATAHLEQFEDRVKASVWERFGFKNKIANIASASLAVVLLAGFFAFQNAPNLEMQVASTRAGVNANMPGYSPAGFSAQRGVKAEPGKVAVSFKSNSNGKQFTVTQQASNWSSDSLLSNHVLATKTPFQTYQDEGKTVYIFNNTNATWVNGGVWYQITGDASLTSDQLLRIANSM